MTSFFGVDLTLAERADLKVGQYAVWDKRK
jgi:hypothetical protein